MLYIFDNYALDPDRRELRSGTTIIAMEPQAFDLLLHLIRQREQVVSRDELIESIWGGRIVSELALSTRINAVRSAIGDSGTEQRLIKTLPRKGVRFVGEVREERKPCETASARSIELRAVEISDVPATAGLLVHQVPGTAVIDGRSEAPSPAMPAPLEPRHFSGSASGRCGNWRFGSRGSDMELLGEIRPVRTGQNEYRNSGKTDPHLRKNSNNVSRGL